LSQNDLKIVIIGTVTGRILQVLERQYRKNHPEFWEDAPVTEKKDRLPRPVSPRGGILIKISRISIKVVKQVILNFLAKKGLLVGLVASTP